MAVYNIINVGANKTINIVGSNLIGNDLFDGRNVCLWPSSNSEEQKWTFSRPTTNVSIMAYLNEKVGLGVQPVASGDDKCVITRDYVDVDFVEATTGYRIKLSGKELYLTVKDGKDGASIYWSSKSTSTYQMWKLTKLTIVPHNSGTTTIYADVGTLSTSTANYGNYPTKMDTNADYIYKYLSQQGFSRAAISAILGNFRWESSLNPGIWEVSNDITQGYGLEQWTKATRFLDWGVNVGVIMRANYSAVNELARSSNNSRQILIDAELIFFIWDFTLRNDYFENSSWTLSRFKAGSDSSIVALTTEFYNLYENPPAGDKSLELRITSAKEWLKRFS